jgi:Zn-dependent metalloprotease
MSALYVPSCIVPPHIIRMLAQSPDDDLRAAALRALVTGGRFRGRRDAFAASNLVAHGSGKQRSIYNVNTGTVLPGQLGRAEGDGPTGDDRTDEAYDGLGKTYDFFFEVFKRDSLDGKGLPLVASVHYDQGYDNAFWDGRQMVFGDGDGKVFNPFTVSLDVIAHELTHGVTQYAAGLSYEGESGALNESFSDVFGSLVKQYSLNQTVEDADWLIGAGLFTSRINGKALRSLKAPGTAYDDSLIGPDPQPATMDKYVQTADDDGGVHINSGIPNHAFYLAATALGGNAWGDAGLIWYNTLLQMQPNSRFADAAAVSIQVAARSGPDQKQAVEAAWDKVGVQPAGLAGLTGLAKPAKGAATRAVDSAARDGLDKILDNFARQLKDYLAKSTGRKGR